MYCTVNELSCVVTSKYGEITIEEYLFKVSSYNFSNRKLYVSLFPDHSFQQRRLI